VCACLCLCVSVHTHTHRHTTRRIVTYFTDILYYLTHLDVLLAVGRAGFSNLVLHTRMIHIYWERAPCVDVFASLCLSVCLSACVCSSVCLPACLSICMYAYLPALTVYVPVCRCVCFPVFLITHTHAHTRTPYQESSSLSTRRRR